MVSFVLLSTMPPGSPKNVTTNKVSALRKKNSIGYKIRIECQDGFCLSPLPNDAAMLA